MIRSFRDATTEAVFNGRCPKGFPADLMKVARRKLVMVDSARELKDLKSPPGNKLHALLRDREGQWAIWINDRCRVCFEWTADGPVNVEITDYH